METRHEFPTPTHRPARALYAIEVNSEGVTAFVCAVCPSLARAEANAVATGLGWTPAQGICPECAKLELELASAQTRNRQPETTKN